MPGSWWSWELWIGNNHANIFQCLRGSLWSPALSFQVVQAKEFHWSHAGATVPPSSAADALEHSNLCQNMSVSCKHRTEGGPYGHRALNPKATVKSNFEVETECQTVCKMSLLSASSSLRCSVQHPRQAPVRLKLLLSRVQQCIQV